MQLRIERRAEIALRSLQKVDQKHIDRALTELVALDRVALRSSPKLRILMSDLSGKKLFVYRGSLKLRLVLSFEGDTCVLEDIVNHDRLMRLVKQGEQE
ncbi:hypothetical protein D3C87_1138190 [compost metagenome]